MNENHKTVGEKAYTFYACWLGLCEYQFFLAHIQHNRIRILEIGRPGKRYEAVQL